MSLNCDVIRYHFIFHLFMLQTRDCFSRSDSISFKHNFNSMANLWADVRLTFDSSIVINQWVGITSWVSFDLSLIELRIAHFVGLINWQQYQYEMWISIRIIIDHSNVLHKLSKSSNWTSELVFLFGQMIINRICFEMHSKCASLECDQMLKSTRKHSVTESIYLCQTAPMEFLFATNLEDSSIFEV